jgi:hypothetical protein
MSRRPPHTGADFGVVVRVGEHPLTVRLNKVSAATSSAIVGAI